MTIEIQNQINTSHPMPRPNRYQVSPTELCFEVPPCIAECLAAYVEDTGRSWDDAAAMAIALLLMQTGYADKAVDVEYARLSGIKVAA